MNISWQVNAPVTNPFVRVGRSADELDFRLDADLVSLTTPFVDVTPVDSVPLIPPAEVSSGMRTPPSTGSRRARPTTTPWVTTGWTHARRGAFK